MVFNSVSRFVDFGVDKNVTFRRALMFYRYFFGFQIFGMEERIMIRGLIFVC